MYLVKYMLYIAWHILHVFGKIHVIIFHAIYNRYLIKYMYLVKYKFVVLPAIAN